MTYLQALIIAIVEGITEFLPVSSTGHMIITENLLGLTPAGNSAETIQFVKLYTIIIQFAAILSVVGLYRKRFFQPLKYSKNNPCETLWKRMLAKYDFYLKLFVAFIPAAIFGLLLKKKIDIMLESPKIVSFSLFIGGVLLLFVDKWFNKVTENQSISFSKALKIGCFQVLSIIPGVSRSAATIVGGMAQKLNRKNAAEFSFFLAVPTMLAASALELFDTYKFINNSNIGVLLFGFVISFIVAMIAIKTFLAFLTRYGFKVFGYYRIILGLILIILLFSGYNLSVVG